MPSITMKLAIRFRFYKPVTPSCQIVELTDEQWREFFLSEDTTKRRDYMIKLLGKEYLDIKELWWIPLDDNMELKIHRKKKLHKPPIVNPTKEQIEQFRQRYQAEVLRANNEPGSEPIDAEELARMLDDLSDNEIIESIRYGSSPESIAHVTLYYN